MHHTILHFPQINLQTRQAHKLRGYFADQFGQESDLFHNHDAATGKSIYRYPRIQYKIVRRHPMVVGIGEGAQLLVERFMRIRELEIEGRRYPTEQKNLKSQEVEIGATEALVEYRFVTPWLALNQENYQRFVHLSPTERQNKLQSILRNNIFSFLKSIPYFEQERVMVHFRQTTEQQTFFKNKAMQTFSGSFVTNMQLPDYIGLGKSTARGFGTIERVSQ
ncbi:MAG: CRISPR-associated endonuclease Cas6 [Saprospiraceae bacterium]